MRCFYLFIALCLSLPLFGQYQGIPMTGSNIKPNQIRWTRDIGADSIFVMCADTVTGKPFWFATKKSTLLSGGGGGATNTDNQTLSLLSGGGTLKLTKTGSVSDFVQLMDSSATNEIELPTQTGNNGKYLTTNGTIPSWATVTTGTVTSVGMTVPTGMTVTGSPITSTGTFAVSLANDLSALEGLSGAGYAVRTSTDTWTQRTFGVNAGQLTVTNNTGVAGNTSFGLATTAVTAGSYGSGSLVPVITVDAYGRLTAATTAAVSYTEVDGSVTNEGSLTVAAGTGTTSIVNSNTSGSTGVTFTAGTGLGISEVGNVITYANTAPDQVVSITGAGINAVTGTYPTFTVTGTEVDGSVSNEGSLTVSAGTATTSVISSNTSGSTAVTFTAGTGLSITEVGNVITYANTSAGTVTSVAATAPAAGFSISGSPITGAGTFVFSLSDDLAGLEAMSNSGFVVRTGTNTYANRSISAASGDITVTNGTGVIGNTTIDLSTTAVAAGTYGASNSIPVYTVDSKGRLTASSQVTVLSQALSRPLAGTLKLTNYSGASTFVNLPDSSQANEGLLTMSSGGANITQISSNTAGSNTQVISVTGGLTSSIAGNTVTITGAALSGVKHVKAATTDSGRGLLATMNTPKDTATIGLNYTGMATYNYLDTMDMIAYKDSSLAKNSKTQKKYVNYNAFIDVSQSTSSTYSLTAGTAADIKLPDTGLYLCFSYNATTGEITYTGTIPKMFVISGHVSYKYSLINSANSLYLQLKPFGGAYGQIGIDSGNNTSTTQFYGLSVMKIINLSQGDKIKLQMKSDGTGTATVNNGYFNIFALSDNYNPN